MGQINRLNFPEAQRRINVVQLDRHQHIATLGLPRFVAHEISRRPDAFVGPDDDYAFGDIQGSLKLRAPTLAARKSAIPPNRETCAVQRLYQPSNAGLVVTLVGDEYLAHGPTRRFKSSIIHASRGARMPRCFIASAMFNARSA
jgi:hypothetical protein